MTVESSDSPANAWIDAPSEATFRASFDEIAPPVSYFKSSLGTTAYYLLKGAAVAASNDINNNNEKVIILHGVCTPALGMSTMARELLRQKPNMTLVLLDYWGHGLTSSPQLPHTPELIHQQLLGLFNHLQWTNAHLLGYSLGGSLVTTFAALHRNHVCSLFLIAPGGLLDKEKELPSELTADDIKEMSTRDQREEAESRKRIFDWLEGASSINVPIDWKEQTQKGIVVAPALRQWQLDHHKGHLYSVASFLRNGNVFNQDEKFKMVASHHIPVMTVLGEKDEICTPAHLDRVGLHNYYVVPNSDHTLSRSKVPEVVEQYVKFLDSIQ